MAKSLLDKLGLTDDIPESEVRYLMDKVYGMGGLISSNELVYPSETKYSIRVRYNAGKINSIESGPRFLPKKFDELCRQIRSELIEVKQGIASDILFCRTNPIQGIFTDHEHGIQILPPPIEAPRPPNQIADNPFVIEFPINISSDMMLTNQRRMRVCREWALILNVLLNKPIKSTNPSLHQSWFLDMSNNQQTDSEPSIKWGQEFYSIRGLPAYKSDYSVSKDILIQKISHKLYYSDKYFGSVSGELEIPDTLSESLQIVNELNAEARRKFLQAAFWISSGSNGWNNSKSSYFIGLVSAIESLVDKSTIENERCSECGSILGVTKGFENFLEKYVPINAENSFKRNVLYDIRSKLVHGSSILSFDEFPFTFGSPDWWNEYDSSIHLSNFVRVGILNWLWAQW